LLTPPCGGLKTNTHNRFATNEDIINKLLIFSDSYINSLRMEAFSNSYRCGNSKFGIINN